MSKAIQDQIRQHIQIQRRKLKTDSLIQFESLSQAAIQSWIAMIGTEKKNLQILAYLPLTSELSLNSFFAWAMEQNHSIFLPRVKTTSEQGAGELEICGPFEAITEWAEPHFVRSSLGVWEPALTNPSVPFEVCNQLDFVLVPGVAFSKEGYRIGLGKGFYDRLLARLVKVPKVSFAFDFQIIEEGFSINPWDQKVDCVVTPSRQFSS